MILTIRTDKPLAEIGLYSGNDQLEYQEWEAHRELGRTIHLKIRQLLESQNADWADIAGVVYYHGPGSFTGLRIGASVANALAVGLGVPVSSTGGDDWIEVGLETLKNGNGGLALPEYGSDPHTTTPRK